MPVDEEMAIQTERNLRLRLFSDVEMARRLSALRRGLAENSFDAMLLTDEPNVCYVTGLDVPSFATRARPIMVLVPAAGDPVLVCSRSQSPNARAMSWVQQIATFNGFEEEAIDTVSGLIIDVALNRGSIACELGREQRLGLTQRGFTALGDRLPGVTWVDASTVIWPVRQVKSEEELAYMRMAGSINASALEQATRSAREGLSERGISQSWARAVLELGGERPGYLAVHSGMGNYRRISGRATGRRLERGDLLWMDAGCIYRQYWSDLTRLVAIGDPKAEDVKRYELAYDVVGAIVAEVHAGMTAGDLAGSASRICASAGIEMAGPARIGHGVGLEITEPPSVRLGDATVLRAGMTLAIETGVGNWDGYFVLEDNFVIGTDGAELLAPRASRALVVVGG